jgi:hypothetical protein
MCYSIIRNMLLSNCYIIKSIYGNPLIGFRFYIKNTFEISYLCRTANSILNYFQHVKFYHCCIEWKTCFSDNNLYLFNFGKLTFGINQNYIQLHITIFYNFKYYMFNLQCILSNQLLVFLINIVLIS